MPKIFQIQITSNGLANHRDFRIFHLLALNLYMCKLTLKHFRSEELYEFKTFIIGILHFTCTMVRASFGS